MKALFTYILLLTSISVFADCGIQAIAGSTNFCPGEEVRFTTTYEFYNSTVTPTPRETVYMVYFEFYQNGTLLKTLEASKFDKYTYCGYNITGEAEVTINKLNNDGTVKNKVNLTLGNFTVQARVRTLYVTYVSVPREYKKSKLFNSGEILGPITGATNICPGSSSIFSVPALAGTPSYTWEVPLGWTVNGILGPIVTGQEGSVSITSCSSSAGVRSANITCSPTFSVYTIKVKAVGAACADSNYVSKTITIDYPFTISETNLASGRTKLSVNTTVFPNYSWSLPGAWTNVSGASTSSVTFTSNGISGSATLTTKTPCNNTYTRAYYYIPPSQPGDPGWPGDPGNPGDCEPEIMNQNHSVKSGNVIYLKDPCGDVPPLVSLYANGHTKYVALTKSFEGYEFDISDLKAGPYIMRVKTARGKYKTIKFIKLD